MGMILLGNARCRLAQHRSTAEIGGAGQRRWSSARSRCWGPVTLAAGGCSEVVRTNGGNEA